MLANQAGGYDSSLWQVFSSTGVDRLSSAFLGFVDTALFDYLPGWLAYQIRVVSQVAAAVLATFVICRRTFKLDPLAAAIAGFLAAHFAMSGQLIQSVLSYTPLTILTLSLVFEKPTDAKRWAGLIAAGLLISGTAYLSRLLPFLGLAHFVWFVFVEPQRSVRNWLIIAVFSIAVIGLRAQDIIAVILQAGISQRLADQTFADGGQILRQISGAILVFSLPVPALILAMFAASLLTCWKAVQGYYKVVLAAAALILFTVTFALTKEFLIKLLPILASYQLSRALDLTWLYFAIGGGCTVAFLHKWANQAKWQSGTGLLPRVVRRYGYVVVSLVLLVSLDQKFKVAKDWISQGSYVQAYENEYIQDFAAKAREDGAPFRVEPFQMYTNFFHAYGLETAGGYQALTNRRYKEFWDKIIAPSETQHHGDRFMLNPARHQTTWDFKKEYNLNLLSLANVRYFISRDRLEADSLRLIAARETPWSALQVSDKIKEMFVTNFSGGRQVFIYENKAVLPRFFMVDNVQIFPTEKEVLTAMSEADLETLQDTAFLAADAVPPELSETATLSKGKISLGRYQPDEITLDVELKATGLLVVSNGYSDLWKVTIDGKPGKIVPADHAFWAVPLPANAKKIEFRYSLPIGLSRPKSGN